VKSGIVTLVPSSTSVRGRVTVSPSLAGSGVIVPTVGSVGSVLSTLISVDGPVVAFQTESVIVGSIVVSPSGSAVSGLQLTSSLAGVGSGVHVQSGIVTVDPSSAVITTSGEVLLVIYGAVVSPSTETIVA